MGEAACNLCGATNRLKLFDETPVEGRVFSITRCRECGLVATVPQPDSEFLAGLYDKSSYKDDTVSGAYCLNEDTSGPDFAFALEKLSALTSGRKLLDVGCGAGAFLTQALSRGWDAHGIEPSPYASSMAKELHGYRIRAEYLHEETYPEESFDAVSLWYVLEHAPDPRSLLETCNRLLKPGGALLVAVPNWSYIRLRRRLVQINKGKPGTVHPHEHLYQYTSGTMKGFIESTGYDFVSEHGASPYMVSGAAINFMKKAAQLLAFGVRAVTGTNLSGILMLGRKKVPS